MSLDVLNLAKSYPYEIPSRSFIFSGGAHEELVAGAPFPDVSGRKPVLAVGSNQSPEQLARKFKGPDIGTIPVSRGTLKDFDIVYSSHVASYGAIPTTLRHSPATLVTLSVTWLTPDQETRMHETEVTTSNYIFGKLDGIELALSPEWVLSSAFVYSSRRGALVRDGHPVAQAGAPAERRSWPSLTQVEIQTHVRDQTAPGEGLDDFIHASVTDASIRTARTEALAANSLAFNYSGFTEKDL
ncbi:MAG: hypothetical protein HQ512_07825 [Rhodospirillales bacterium]|nr:hypothetical protein [Rhodospirillales bacterium]